ncbi:hypothetical protein ACVWWG_009531 [Bradyrhizobium sp. LB7.2]
MPTGLRRVLRRSVGTRHGCASARPRRNTAPYQAHAFAQADNCGIQVAWLRDERPTMSNIVRAELTIRAPMVHERSTTGGSLNSPRCLTRLEYLGADLACTSAPRLADSRDGASVRRKRAIMACWNTSRQCRLTLQRRKMWGSRARASKRLPKSGCRGVSACHEVRFYNPPVHALHISGIRFAADHPLQTHVPHQSRHRATGNIEALALELSPDLTHAIVSIGVQI